MSEILNNDQMMDFSEDLEPIQFRIKPDIFTAVPAIPPKVALSFSNVGNQLQAGDGSEEEQMALLENVIRSILVPESAERFIARLSDTANPISFRQITRVIRWLMEEKYGQRPTMSSSDISTGSSSQADGMNSTVGAPALESIPAPSNSVGS